MSQKPDRITEIYKPIGFERLCILNIEQFSIECRKTKTRVITLANHKGHRSSSEPIKTRSNFM